MRRACAARSQRRTGFFLAKTVQKMPRQQQDVAAALAQGRQMQRDDVQTVVEILAKAPGRYFAFQIPVGCGHNAYIHLFAAAAAHPLDFLFLKHAQNLDLQAQVHFTYFIQKDGAAVSQFKASGSGTDGVGKSAFFMAEELALQQFLGDGPAVNGNKRLCGAAAVVVQSADQQFLAGSGFAGYKHGAVCGRHFAEHFEDIGQGRALSYDAACI